MPRYKLTIEYDGTNYVGWQKQDDRPSIQAALADAIYKFCGEQVDVVGAGRTDAGVHAMAQAAHVDLQKEQDPFRIMQAMNAHLVEAGHRVAVLMAEEVINEFHARFSAIKRHYTYRIINRRPHLAIDYNRAWRVVEDLDIDAMQKAASYLLGNHDFTSFRDSACQAKSPVKTLEQLEIGRHREHIFVQTSARSFLHHQVRIMVGTLVMVGKGKWQPEDVRTALEARDRTKSGPTAPADGLYLAQIDY